VALLLIFCLLGMVYQVLAHSLVPLGADAHQVAFSGGSLISLHHSHTSVISFELDLEQVWCDDGLHLMESRASRNDVVGHGHIDDQEIYLQVPSFSLSPKRSKR